MKRFRRWRQQRILQRALNNGQFVRYYMRGEFFEAKGAIVVGLNSLPHGKVSVEVRQPDGSLDYFTLRNPVWI